MSALFPIITSLFFLWIIRSMFVWLYFWQSNNYRPDRFFHYLFEKKLHFFQLLSLNIIVKLLLLFLFFATIFNDNYLIYYHALIIILYILQFVIMLRELANATFKRPSLSLKNQLILFLSLSFSFFVYAFPLMDTYYWLLLIDIASPFILSFFVFLFFFPSELYADWIIEQAAKKINLQKGMSVIAITGSIDKSSTRDAIAALLEKEYKVVKTQGNEGTIIGIAKTILERLKSDTEVFVVDINAYAPGEISTICKLIHPNVAIITPITMQYLSRFKTLKAVKKLNYELIEAIPKNGLCIFSANNKASYELYRQTRKPKVFYLSLQKEIAVKALENGIIASHISRKADTTFFAVNYKGKNRHFSLKASNHINRFLPGIYIGAYLGMSTKDMKSALLAIK